MNRLDTKTGKAFSFFGTGSQVDQDHLLRPECRAYRCVHPPGFCGVYACQANTLTGYNPSPRKALS